MTNLQPFILAGAALAALLTFWAHVFLGGRLFARILLTSELRAAAKHTLYYCWHRTTVSLLIIAAAFAWAALDAARGAAVYVATALAMAFLVLNLGQNARMRLSYARHPQRVFFLVISALGVGGLVHG